MTQREARLTMAAIRAVWPGVTFETETMTLWGKLLLPYDFALMTHAVERVALSAPRSNPMLSVFIHEYARLALKAPSTIEAWTSVLDYAQEKPEQKTCSFCGGRGWIDLDASQEDTDTTCPKCKGAGFFLERKTRLHPFARKALSLVGGDWTIARSEHPHLLRRDFFEIYKQLIEEETSRAVEGRQPLTRRKELTA